MSPADDARSVVNSIVDLSKLALTFGRTDRASRYPDGVTLESDTDHTVMLALVASSLASRIGGLDVGLVCQYAVVHDLVEAYAGDTCTLGGLSGAEVEAKQERETAAYLRIRGEFGTSLPWVPEMIEAYESQASDEARFVKALDKFLPKINHLLNDAIVIRENHISLTRLRDSLGRSRANLIAPIGRTYPELIRLWDLLTDDLMALVEANEHKESTDALS